MLFYLSTVETKYEFRRLNCEKGDFSALCTTAQVCACAALHGIKRQVAQW